MSVCFCLTLREASLFVRKMRWMWHWWILEQISNPVGDSPRGLFQMKVTLNKTLALFWSLTSLTILSISFARCGHCRLAGGGQSDSEDRVVWRLAVGWPLLCLIAVGALEHDEEYRCGPSVLVFNQCFPSERGPHFHCADQASFCLEQPQDECSIFIILFIPLNIYCGFQLICCEFS